MTEKAAASGQAAKPAGGVNIGKRLLTAGILIPAVVFATSYPQTWIVLNLGRCPPREWLKDML
jgi:hypothetical protein